MKNCNGLKNKFPQQTQTTNNSNTLLDYMTSKIVIKIPVKHMTKVNVNIEEREILWGRGSTLGGCMF